MKCQVCLTPEMAVVLNLPSPSITSGGELLASPVTVAFCSSCGHVQSPALANEDLFYANDYRISLQSDEHDQVYEVRAGVPVFRTDRQAEVFCEQVSLRPGSRVLDYGAGKATTLRKVSERRPDIEPFVYDVSTSYQQYWEGWVPKGNTAPFETPTSWETSFDAIMAHYVLEHVSDLSAMLGHLRRLLKPQGLLYFSVPDWKKNPGDLLVVDHVNHFTEDSICRLLEASGFELRSARADLLPAAFVVTACPAGTVTPRAILDFRDIKTLKSDADFWNQIALGVHAASSHWADKRVAVYGAGFYGTWLASRLQESVKVTCFVDANPHVQGEKAGIQVVSPEEAEKLELELILIGLNPAHARQTAETIPFLKKSLSKLRFIDDFARSS
jgi:SAM-dependent methyltransferase